MEKKNLGLITAGIAIIGVLLMAVLPIYSGNSINAILITIDVPDLKMFGDSELFMGLIRFPGIFFGSTEEIDADFSIMSSAYLVLSVVSIGSLVWMCIEHPDGEKYIRRVGIILIASSIIFFISVAMNLSVEIDETYKFSDYWSIGMGSWSAILPLGAGILFASKPEMVK